MATWRLPPWILLHQIQDLRSSPWRSGITLAHLLRRQRPELVGAILEPPAEPFSQPGWTLVGGGLMDREPTRRPRLRYLPSAVFGHDHGRHLLFPSAAGGRR